MNPTDKHMMDWLSSLHCCSFERHYQSDRELEREAVRSF